MIRRKIFLIIVILFMGIGVLPKGSIAYGEESPDTSEVSYYFIHYNGDEQEIKINENVSLILTGWKNDSKSSVTGKLENHAESENQTKDIILSVDDGLNKIAISEKENFQYRLVVSDLFTAEEVTPHEIQSQNKIVAENENGTSIEDVKLIDEFGTVIEEKGSEYFLTENNQKTVISEEKYHSLNTVLRSVDASKTAKITPTNIEDTTSPSIQYTTHVQDLGWLNTASDGELSGTVGQAKRLESIKISVNNVQDLGVKYTTHVQDYGWLNYVSDGAESGTTGKAKRLEAIKIELTGSKAGNFDIYYRVHSQDYGWLGWAKNGEAAGTEGLAKRLESLEIVLVEKGGQAPGSTENSFISKPPSVIYSTHVQDYGWMAPVTDGKMSGTQGKAKRLEAIKIDFQDPNLNGGIEYSTHVQDYGWLNNVSKGNISGTVGKSKRLEAIQISLTGEVANKYDIYYRVHIQDYGWLGWAKNGMKAGSEGKAKRLEAIEIKLVPKGQGASVNEREAFLWHNTVFLDPGHGGSDPGAVSGSYHEADLNLAVAKKVKSLLANLGYNVVMSRNNDSTVELLDRSKMANDLHADIFVSIHTNSTGTETTSVSGIESYFYKYFPNYPPKINGEMHNNPVRLSRSMTLANLLQQNMVNYTGAVNRGADGETLSVVRESAMPATLVEIGFINNPSERQKLFTDTYQNKLAKAIADGINDYFKIY